MLKFAGGIIIYAKLLVLVWRHSLRATTLYEGKSAVKVPSVRHKNVIWARLNRLLQSKDFVICDLFLNEVACLFLRCPRDKNLAKSNR